MAKNNERLSKRAAEDEGRAAPPPGRGGGSAAPRGPSKAHKAASLGTLPDAPRDQGFTRPKVLVLLPFRSAALKVVSRLLDLCPPSQKVSVEHRDRFFDDFGVEEDDEEEAELKRRMQKKRRGAAGATGGATAGGGGGGPEEMELTGGKPADHVALFSGNNDDHIRLGIKLTRKSVKLYSEFYTSDIIVASPLGLITKLGETESEKDKDVDFLSSIEILVIDQADVILMQAWQHVQTLMERMNAIPKKQHGTDFMRIREWYLNGWAKRYRQTLLLSAFAEAGMNALFHRGCANHAGKVKLRVELPGILSKVIPQVRQVYERVDCPSAVDADDARFHHFAKLLYPRLASSLQGGTMIFVRSYFEFVRLRNFLKAEGASFALLGEYTKAADISRARSWFFHGARRILLYTERCHFYHRFAIRGIQELVFVSLPEYAHYYAEVLNLLEGTGSPSCTVLFTKYDKLQLERVVGSGRSKKMLEAPNKTFMFC